MFPKSRAALSLLGYCYYQVQDFMSAANWYILYIILLIIWINLSILNKI